MAAQPMLTRFTPCRAQTLRHRSPAYRLANLLCALTLAASTAGAQAAGYAAPTVGAVPTPDITTTNAAYGAGNMARNGAGYTTPPVMAAPALVSDDEATVQLPPLQSAQSQQLQLQPRQQQPRPQPAARAAMLSAANNLRPEDAGNNGGGVQTYASNGPIFTPYTAAPAMNTAAMTPAGPVAPQDFNQIRQAAQSYLAQQTEGMPGQVTISIADSSPRGLAQCEALEPFIPPGVRLWGRAMLGMRCNGQRPWTIYLQVRIGVIGDYYVAARPINAGETIGPQDLLSRHGDLTALPASIVTSTQQAVGSTAANYIAAGFPFRTDFLRSALAIRFGQQVRVVARGNGFAVTSEGSALANGSVGQPIRVKTASGVVISGIVQPDSTVEVAL